MMFLDLFQQADLGQGAMPYFQLPEKGPRSVYVIDETVEVMHLRLPQGRVVLNYIRTQRTEDLEGLAKALILAAVRAAEVRLVHSVKEAVTWSGLELDRTAQRLAPRIEPEVHDIDGAPGKFFVVNTVLGVHAVHENGGFEALGLLYPERVFVFQAVPQDQAVTLQTRFERAEVV